MLVIAHYIASFGAFFPLSALDRPWQVTARASALVGARLDGLGPDFVVHGQVAVHRQAVVETGVVFKGPVIVSRNCFVAAHAYLRGGVFLAEGVTVGPGCEVKASFVFGGSTLAHFNYVGDSLVGAHVNLEAGSVTANHFNEREEKAISVVVDGQRLSTGTDKFGALIGDRCRIGANAVTSPGTVLRPGSVVGRLALVDQVGDR
ncbi:MAG: LpxA family transferase [Ferruginibacter sp.]|nr:LpxA family transferase [Cytophagales bacterium]